MSELAKIYRELGYPSKTTFLRAIKRDHPSLYSDAVKFADNQFALNAFDAKIQYGKVENITYLFDYVLFLDLMDMTNLSRKNKNFKWILNILEWRSRYVWSFALKTKQAAPIAECLEKVIKDLPSYEHAFIRLVSDQGNEFEGEVRAVCEKYHINRLYQIPKRTFINAPVESYNRTLSFALRRVFAANGNHNWVDHLDTLTQTYNNKTRTLNYHGKKLRLTPARQIKVDRTITDREIDLTKFPGPTKFAIGDRVHIIRKLRTFEKKSRTPKLSLQSYEIVGFDEGFYKLKKPKPNLYLERELFRELNRETADSASSRTQEQHSTYAAEVSELDKQNRFNRLQRREVAVGHEAELLPDGTVTLKARLRPAVAKRVRRPPQRYLV